MQLSGSLGLLLLFVKHFCVLADKLGLCLVARWARLGNRE